MIKLLFRAFAGCLLFSSAIGVSQMAGFPQGEKVDADSALNRALKASSLTVNGKPFHAVMEIGAAGSKYSGRVEVWWVAPTVYKLQVSSPQFSQLKIVNGDKVWEKNDGDYYPRWLENFVLAILDPIPVEKNFLGNSLGAVMVGEKMSGCLKRDDRPGGITDEMTWGVVCFSGDEPKLQSVITTNVDIDFKDWQKFGKKQIARTVTTDVEGYKEIVGHMTTLEEMKNSDPAMFEAKEVTPPEKRIATRYVSTLMEEGMVEVKPEIQWPSVREGKTEGYMIVYARTDRTGQVRETAKHNSDQPGLEDFGIQAALKYKFKPLVVDGVPMQMEMPLVLHFTSRLEDPLPILSVEQMKKQMGGCMPGALPVDTPQGTSVTVRVSVNEQGNLTGMGSVGGGDQMLFVAAMNSLRGCKFAPYVVNGKPTYYKGDIVLVAP